MTATKTIICRMAATAIMAIAVLALCLPAPALAEDARESRPAVAGKDAWDFFEWLPGGVGSDAISVLEGSPIASSTTRGDVRDATSLENLRGSVSWLRRCNDIREDLGLRPLRVNYTLMAISMSNCNWSLEGMAHSRAFNVGENLAWGFDDPFARWYDREKHDFEASNGKETGHYLNIVDPDYVYTGFALAQGGSYGNIYGQSFAYDWFGKGEILRADQVAGGRSIVLTEATERATVTVDEFQRDLDDFMAGKERPDVAMQRLYNPNSGEHFYTASAVERDHLVSVGWVHEGVGWTAPETSATPVFRLYNANAGDHHYTASAVERDHLVSVGWRDEGVGWYSDDARGVALFRQYNPNAAAGSHNYTASAVERDHLVSVGWNDEGVAWYGVE